MIRVTIVLAALTCAASADAQVPPEDEDDADAAPAEAPDAFEVAGRIHLRHRLAPGKPPAGQLELAHARFQIAWHPNERVEGQLGADFEPILSGGSTTSELLPRLLDAFVEVETTEWLSIRGGHRKVPFSGARLVSLGDLRPIRRGEYVGLLSADDPANLTASSLGYAGRKVGFDLRFEFRRLSRLALDVGVSQGDRGPMDPAARATVRIVKGLHVAAAISALRSPDAAVNEDEFWAVAYELDVLFDRKKWRAELEGATGGNWLGGDGSRGRFVGGYALVSHEFDLGDGDAPSLEPLLRAEIVDETTDGACDEVVGLTAGATLHALEVIRVQANVERLDRANGGECAAVADPDENRLFLQLALDV